MYSTFFFFILCCRNWWGYPDTLWIKYLGSGEMLIPYKFSLQLKPCWGQGLLGLVISHKGLFL